MKQLLQRLFKRRPHPEVERGLRLMGVTGENVELSKDSPVNLDHMLGHITRTISRTRTVSADDIRNAHETHTPLSAMLPSDPLSAMLPSDKCRSIPKIDTVKPVEITYRHGNFVARVTVSGGRLRAVAGTVDARTFTRVSDSEIKGEMWDDPHKVLDYLVGVVNSMEKEPVKIQKDPISPDLEQSTTLGHV